MLQVVLTGLLVLLPRMRAPLLAFPKLCSAFFSLVGAVLEVHPDELARLPGAAPDSNVLSEPYEHAERSLSRSLIAAAGDDLTCCHFVRTLPAVPAPTVPASGCACRGAGHCLGGGPALGLDCHRCGRGLCLL